jgi:hypothetical protein
LYNRTIFTLPKNCSANFKSFISPPSPGDMEPSIATPSQRDHSAAVMPKQPSPAVEAAQLDSHISGAVGILPWTSEFDRNLLGLAISSTYESGDDSKYFMEVKFYGNDIPFFEYNIEFTETRIQNLQRFSLLSWSSLDC